MFDLTRNFFLFACLICLPPASHADEQPLILSDKTEISIEHFPGQGDYAVLWLGPEYGIRSGHKEFASLLHQQQFDVWQVDLLNELFHPLGSASMRKLNPAYVADIINYVIQTSAKPVLVVSDSYGATAALRGIYYWQQHYFTAGKLLGALLFTPSAYVAVPPLGAPPEYLPIVSVSNIPVMIVQAGNNSNRWQLDKLMEKLAQHGTVYSEILPGIVGLFYDEARTANRQEIYQRIVKKFPRYIALLKRHPISINASVLAPVKNAERKGIDIYLKTYQGNIAPLAIKLHDANGQLTQRNDYRNKVTVVNFWATWCPPCIEEIPSLNRLRKLMQGKPFELISINYAEDKSTIKGFLAKVNVDYPVLLDQDGSFAAQWNVVAYPSTFVIGKDGKIKYGVNAAIEWDNPQLVTKINQLLAE